MKENTHLLKFSYILLLFAISLAIQSCGSKNIKLSQTDLTKPESLVLALKKGVNAKHISDAKQFYQDGLEMEKQQRWGPAFKSYAGSALNYPTAKALLGVSKAKANSYLSNEKNDKGISRLKTIQGYLLSAVAVAKLKKGPEDLIKNIKHDIACIDEYLASAIQKGNCQYVDLTLNSVDRFIKDQDNKRR